MTTKRLGLAAIGLIVLGPVAVALLSGTCATEPPPPPRSAQPKTQADAQPRRRGGGSDAIPRRSSSVAANGAGSESSEATGGGEPPKGRVRVRVTRDGSPVEGVSIWLLPLAPGEAPPDVPNTRWSDDAYFGLPRHLGLAERAALPPSRESWIPLGSTTREGTAELPAPALGLYTLLLAADGGELLVGDLPVVRLVSGETAEVALSVRPSATITGRCLDDDGSPVGGAMVQAFDAREERAASALVRTDANGAFALTVDASRPSVRVRAAAPRNLPMCDTEAALPPVLDDALVEGVVPGGPALDVRLRREAGVVLELTADIPFGHLQVEELVWDAAAQVWGRLGGPVYGRDIDKSADPKHAFVALSRADAQRPLMLWTWGSPPELTGVDPRGQTRVTARFARGRKVTVTGKNWLAGDRVRVVCSIGPAGGEFPGVWVENEVAPGGSWSRDDTPPCEVEVRLVRGGREIGPRPRVAAGSEDATVRIDL